MSTALLHRLAPPRCSPLACTPELRLASCTAIQERPETFRLSRGSSPHPSILCEGPGPASQTVACCSRLQVCSRRQASVWMHTRYSRSLHVPVPAQPRPGPCGNTSRSLPLVPRGLLQGSQPAEQAHPETRATADLPSVNLWTQKVGETSFFLEAAFIIPGEGAGRHLGHFCRKRTFHPERGWECLQCVNNLKQVTPPELVERLWSAFLRRPHKDDLRLFTRQAELFTGPSITLLTWASVQHRGGAQPAWGLHKPHEIILSGPAEVTTGGSRNSIHREQATF